MAERARTVTALFVGLGSIGTRHLKNLVDYCAAQGLVLEAWALRSSSRPLPEEVAALLAGQLSALPPGARYRLAFITGPTHLHAQTLESLRGTADCFFIEKPIFEKTGYRLDALGLGPGQKAYVAAPMRWTALYTALKARLQDTPVYSVRAICSSYLPSWRPGADYRQVYSARADMGGGVTLDLIHEWDYLADLFGLPDSVYNLRGHFSHLDITSDDLSVYIARYPGFLCEVHLDYFGREYRRTAEFFTEAGTFVADFGAGTLSLPDGTVEDYGEPANTRYTREMAYFMDYAQGPAAESLNSPRHALAVLATVLGEGQ